MESMPTVRADNSDFLALYTSPRLNAYILSLSHKLANAEDREDAIADAWADILALNPIAVEDAMDIAATTIQRHVRAERRKREKEFPVGIESLMEMREATEQAKESDEPPDFHDIEKLLDVNLGSSPIV